MLKTFQSNEIQNKTYVEKYLQELETVRIKRPWINNEERIQDIYERLHKNFQVTIISN